MFGEPEKRVKCDTKLVYLYSYPNFLDFYLKKTPVVVSTTSEIRACGWKIFFIQK